MPKFKVGQIIKDVTPGGEVVIDLLRISNIAPGFGGQKKYVGEWIIVHASGEVRFSKFSCCSCSLWEGAVKATEHEFEFWRSQIGVCAYQ